MCNTELQNQNEIVPIKQENENEMQKVKKLFLPH